METELANTPKTPDIRENIVQSKIVQFVIYYKTKSE